MNRTVECYVCDGVCDVKKVDRDEAEGYSLWYLVCRDCGDAGWIRIE